MRFSGNDQQILYALGDVCQSETPKMENFTTVAELYDMDEETLQVEQKMFTTFCLKHGFPKEKKLSEVLGFMQENHLLKCFQSLLK